jgi:hypothetical protein
MKQYFMHMIEGGNPGITRMHLQNLMPKGDGASLMVADFVSVDFGWLES